MFRGEGANRAIHVLHVELDAHLVDGLLFRVWGLGFRVWGSGFGVRGLGWGVRSEFRIQGPQGGLRDFLPKAASFNFTHFGPFRKKLSHDSVISLNIPDSGGLGDLVFHHVVSVASFGFRVSGFGFRVSGFGFRVLDFGFRVSGFGFRVLG